MTDRYDKTIMAVFCRYIDGNFRVSPPEFNQLYVIRCTAGNGTITAVYALMQNKTREIYRQLFQALQDRCAELDVVANPQYIHADFEIAAHMAVRQLFPNAELKGCFYHLTQVKTSSVVA